MVKTRRTSTRSWAEGSEAIRIAPREPASLLRRFLGLWANRDIPQATFRIGDRVRITDADPQFANRIGIEATVVSGLEPGGDGRLYYRLDNNMSAQPDCLTLLEPGAEITANR